jgi:hypothetical protein
MDLALNVVLLLLALASALAAFGGETWRKNSRPLFKRVTHRGWIALALMFLTAAIGTVKEIRSSAESAKSKAALQKSNQALASIEPTLIQALSLTTTGIRRESDFSTPTLDGSDIQSLRSGKNSQQLMLLGGDSVEFHLFCPDDGNAQSRPPPLFLKVGDREYPFKSEMGSIVVLGQVGEPLPAAIRNPEHYSRCIVKLIIQSTNQDEVKQQLTRLIETAQSARNDPKK